VGLESITFNKWVAVDFDGCLAKSPKSWVEPDVLGEPIMPMVEKVANLLLKGTDIRIFTTRAYTDHTPAGDEMRDKAVAAIKNWLIDVFGQELPITCEKAWGITAIYDDKAISIVEDTGLTPDEYHERPIGSYKKERLSVFKRRERIMYYIVVIVVVVLIVLALTGHC